MTKVDLMLDSGAFSAWKQKLTIDLDAYMRALEKYQEHFKSYVNLDVIPGVLGKVHSLQVVEDSAQVSWDNLMVMKKAGFNPIPVYHAGEHRRWLDKMLEAGFTYIGISSNLRTFDQRVELLDNFFSYLCGNKGFTKIKVHGFGMNAPPILFRYPWYSVDSTTWIMTCAYGKILVPLPTTKYEYDFTVSPQMLCVTDAREGLPPSKALDDGNHFRTLGRATQEYVRDYLKSEGFTIEQAATIYDRRLAVNCRYMKRVSEAYELQPFFGEDRGFFSGTDDSGFGVVKNPFGKIKIIFGLNFAGSHHKVCNEEGIKNRLLSYFHMANRKNFDLEEYVATGLLPEKKEKKKNERIVYDD